MIKKTMWWNLPIEEVEELMQEDKLDTFTCVVKDDEELTKESEKEHERK
jgi:hypothetical protein